MSVCCRVCQGTEGPFLRPCKCEGTIGAVHPRCLAEWVQRSRTLRCEICKHPYTLRKVLRSGDIGSSTVTPTSLLRLAILLTKHVIRQLCGPLLFSLVTFVLLFMVPVVIFAPFAFLRFGVSGTLEYLNSYKGNPLVNTRMCVAALSLFLFSLLFSYISLQFDEWAMEHGIDTEVEAHSHTEAAPTHGVGRRVEDVVDEQAEEGDDEDRGQFGASHISSGAAVATIDVVTKKRLVLSIIDRNLGTEENHWGLVTSFLMYKAAPCHVCLCFALALGWGLAPSLSAFAARSVLKGLQFICWAAASRSEGLCGQTSLVTLVFERLGSTFDGENSGILFNPLGRFTLVCGFALVAVRVGGQVLGSTMRARGHYSVYTTRYRLLRGLFYTLALLWLLFRSVGPIAVFMNIDYFADSHLSSFAMPPKSGWAVLREAELVPAAVCFPRVMRANRKGRPIINMISVGKALASIYPDFIKDLPSCPNTFDYSGCGDGSMKGVSSHFSRSEYARYSGFVLMNLATELNTSLMLLAVSSFQIILLLNAHYSGALRWMRASSLLSEGSFHFLAFLNFRTFCLIAVQSLVVVVGLNCVARPAFAACRYLDPSAIPVDLNHLLELQFSSLHLYSFGYPFLVALVAVVHKKTYVVLARALPEAPSGHHAKEPLQLWRAKFIAVARMSLQLLVGYVVSIAGMYAVLEIASQVADPSTIVLQSIVLILTPIFSTVVFLLRVRWMGGPRLREADVARIRHFFASKVLAYCYCIELAPLVPGEFVVIETRIGIASVSADEAASARQDLCLALAASLGTQRATESLLTAIRHGDLAMMSSTVREGILEEVWRKAGLSKVSIAVTVLLAIVAPMLAAPSNSDFAAFLAPLCPVYFVVPQWASLCITWCLGFGVISVILVTELVVFGTEYTRCSQLLAPVLLVRLDQKLFHTVIVPLVYRCIVLQLVWHTVLRYSSGWMLLVLSIFLFVVQRFRILRNTKRMGAPPSAPSLVPARTLPQPVPSFAGEVPNTTRVALIAEETTGASQNTPRTLIPTAQEGTDARKRTISFLFVARTAIFRFSKRLQLLCRPVINYLTSALETESVETVIFLDASSSSSSTSSSS